MLKRSLAYLVFSFVLAISSLLMAQEVQPNPTPVKRKPITMEMQVPRGIHYYYSGTELKGLEGLKSVVNPLNDPEATRLLEKSGSSNSTGVVFIVGGGVFIVGGLLTAAADPNFTKQDAPLDTQEGIGVGVAIVGLAGIYTGAFKVADSQAEEFNAVQRYNAIVRGEQETTWNLPSGKGFHTDLLAFKF